MRRQHFPWIYIVMMIVLAMYGTFSLIYSITHDRNVPVLTIIFLSTSGLMAVTLIVLAIVSVVRNKKVVVDQPGTTIVEEEPNEESEPEEKQEEEKPVQQVKKPAPRYDQGYRPNTRSDDLRTVTYNRGGSFYVNRVGSGLVLRINGNRIYDMRTNTYYVIEGNQVKEEGSGPVYEINGTRIRYAFGSYLYELSGSNINKVFGGYFASVSGNYLTRYDAGEKYDLGGQLSKDQLLTVVVLLFGTY